MENFIDVSFDSLNKYGEELCGDKVEIIRTKQSVIIVVADGLGSGVKANILATLTSKIAGTMLKEGASIYETVDTIVHTLPVCNVRKLAYSTFTMIEIYHDGSVYIAEYDNPPFVLVRDGRLVEAEKKNTIMNERIVKESTLKLKQGDVVTVVSDGAIHAGVGGILNLGWQWDNVARHIMEVSQKEKCSKKICKSLIEVCRNLYQDKPGDDTTVVTVKMRKVEEVDIFTGPPKNKENDRLAVRNLLQGKGKKIVCGGTAANIVARELKEELIVNMDSLDPNIPPTATIKGIDLVTEGVLTLSKTVEEIDKYLNTNGDVNTLYNTQSVNGAYRLAKMLIEDCTHLNLWVGKAVNPAHQNPDFPMDLSIKLKIVDKLVASMEKLGAHVTLNYID